MKVPENKLTGFGKIQTSQDWNAIEKTLSIVHPIRLIIDGYKVSMHKMEFRTKLVIILFIDGKYDIEVWRSKASEIPEKFYNKKERFLYSKKLQNAAIKAYGKREANKKGFFDKYSFMQYYWTSFRSLKLHLQNTCKEILVCKLDLGKTIGDLFVEFPNV